MTIKLRRQAQHEIIKICTLHMEASFHFVLKMMSFLLDASFILIGKRRPL